MKIRIAIATLLICSAACNSPAMAAGPKITEVTGKSGVRAWLVEDHKLPLISMRFAFKGGVETDPKDKQGLATLTTSMMMQGAGPYDEQAFQQRLADRSIQMDISATRDYVGGEVKCLQKASSEAFRLLALALTKPRFDDSTFVRVRDGQITAIQSQLSNPGWQGRVALYEHVFADHPYSYRSLGALSTIRNITTDDMRGFVADRFAKNNVSIAVVGAISPAELATALDGIFGALPEQAAADRLSNIIWPDRAATIGVRREGTQTVVSFASPSLQREDPDWYAAEIANYILGGGGFISRLMKAVRAKEGLTYGVGTSLSSMEKAGAFVGSFSANNDKVGEALALVSSEWQAFFEKGVTAEEVTAAQDYLTGSVPLTLTSTDAIAGTLLAMQTEKLGMDYLDRLDGLYRAVTVQDVNRVISKWFDPAKASFALVGMPEGIKTDQYRELIKE